MKLWKILVATMIALLLVGAVAMADDHICAQHMVEVNGSHQPVSYSNEKVGNAYMHTPLIQYQVICTKCSATETRYKLGTQAGCNITWGDASQATCTAESFKTGSCSVCNATYTEKVDTYAAHDWRQGQIHAATCLKPIWRIDTCMTCGKTQEITAGDRAACDYVETKISDATCKAPKKVADICKWCGDVKDNSTREVGTASGHDYAWATTIPATCTTKGNEVGTCKVCGGKTEREIPAVGHKADNSTQKTVNATCTAAGKVTADCYVCGQNFKLSDIAALSHAKTTVAYKDAACGYDGNFTYSKCTRCGAMWDGYDRPITAVPVIPANGNHILPSKTYANIKDCTATNNYAEGNCEVCGQYARVYVPAKAHNFPTATNNNIDGTKATCTNAGSGYVKCSSCEEYQWATVPALGHKFQNWSYTDAATCTTDLIATSKCETCKTATTSKIIEEALGHNWVLEAGTDATCTATGTGTRVCTRCLQKQNNVTIPAKGHEYTKVVKTVAPTCDAQGYTVFGCTRCDATQNGNYTAALGHNYSWVVVSKPSSSANGKNEYKCGTCGNVAETKTVKYSNWYYNNTMTSFGPTTRELVGGNDWYRVTPVDVTVDGVYTYDLIASNKYVVGSVTISVNAGTLSVSYKVGNNVDVTDESLLIYASKADLAAGTAVTAPVGAAINVAETFGADSKVLVSLVLTGAYDAAGKSIVDEAAASSLIANID